MKTRQSNNSILYVSLALITSFTYIVFLLIQKTRTATTTTTYPQTNNNTNIDIAPNIMQIPVNLSNPFIPPLRNESVLVPINVSTNIGAVNASYRQIGILTPLNGVNKILPLMGRPLFVNRDKWQYYTLSDQNNSIKLPVVKNGKSCTNEYGCDKLYNGDTIYVEGYNQAFKVTSYDTDTIKYLPFI